MFQQEASGIRSLEVTKKLCGIFPSSRRNTGGGGVTHLNRSWLASVLRKEGSLYVTQMKKGAFAWGLLVDLFVSFFEVLETKPRALYMLDTHSIQRSCLQLRRSWGQGKF